MTNTTKTKYPDLFSALAAFQGKMPTVLKTKTANVPTKTGGSYRYSYADLAALTEAVMPVLSNHGLAFIALPRMGDHGYELVGRLIHESGGTIESEGLPLYGKTPQEIGSSLTYMRRYLLGCMTGVVTDDDTDAQEVPPQRTQPKSNEPRITEEQFVTLREYANTGYPVDKVMRDQWDGKVNTDNITRSQADELIGLLQTMDTPV